MTTDDAERIAGDDRLAEIIPFPGRRRTRRPLVVLRSFAEWWTRPSRAWEATALPPARGEIARLGR